MIDFEGKKGFFFDLDGVVFDTEPQYTIFWGGQCKKYHPDMPGLENDIKGQTLSQIYDKYFNGELKKEQPLITDRLNEFEKNMHFEYIPGLQDFIIRIKSLGLRTAIVTSSNKIKMESVYRQHPEFKQLFDVILTSEDFKESKPSPDCYLTAATYFGLKPDECVVFEDSFNGIKSGKSAKMMTIGLATTNPSDALKPLCDFVIGNYLDI